MYNCFGPSKSKHRLRTEQLRVQIDQTKKKHVLKMEILQIIKDNIRNNETDFMDGQAANINSIVQTFSPF